LLGDCHSDADDNFERENSSAINIQRTFRGARLRAQLTECQYASMITCMTGQNNA
jgi:hypothetical protein